MKECHPDKLGDETGLNSWRKKSKQVIEAYHFLVSINPETTKLNLPEYTETTTTASITDYKFVEGRLIINFQTVACIDISVPKATYVKW
jgi:hypothetical protein